MSSFSQIIFVTSNRPPCIINIGRIGRLQFQSRDIASLYALRKREVVIRHKRIESIIQNEHNTIGS